MMDLLLTIMRRKRVELKKIAKLLWEENLRAARAQRPRCNVRARVFTMMG
jgi:hypothetical protein